MRKLLAVLLALFLITTVVNAQEGYVDQYSGDFFGDTEVTYREYSTFYVTIPTSMSVGTAGDISVILDNIEEGYHVAVGITNMDETGKLPIQSSKGDTGSLYVYRDDQTVVNADGFITNFYPGTDMGTTSITLQAADQMRAGTYSGVISFRVALEAD